MSVTYSPPAICRPVIDVLSIGIKFLLFLYCFAIRKNSSQVQVLWEDHRNDVFVNAFGKIAPLLRPLARSANLP